MQGLAQLLERKRAADALTVEQRAPWHAEYKAICTEIDAHMAAIYAACGIWEINPDDIAAEIVINRVTGGQQP